MLTTSLFETPGKLWLPASAVNLAFVEPKYRVLFVNVVFFMWIIVLSVLLNQPEDLDQPDEQPV